MLLLTYIHSPFIICFLFVVCSPIFKDHFFIPLWDLIFEPALYRNNAPPISEPPRINNLPRITTNPNDLPQIIPTASVRISTITLPSNHPHRNQARTTLQEELQYERSRQRLDGNNNNSSTPSNINNVMNNNGPAVITTNSNNQSNIGITGNPLTPAQTLSELPHQVPVTASPVSYLHLLAGDPILQLYDNRAVASTSSHNPLEVNTNSIALSSATTNSNDSQSPLHSDIELTAATITTSQTQVHPPPLTTSSTSTEEVSRKRTHDVSVPISAHVEGRPPKVVRKEHFKNHIWNSCRPGECFTLNSNSNAALYCLRSFDVIKDVNSSEAWCEDIESGLIMDVVYNDSTNIKYFKISPLGRSRRFSSGESIKYIVCDDVISSKQLVWKPFKNQTDNTTTFKGRALMNRNISYQGYRGVIIACRGNEGNYEYKVEYHSKGRGIEWLTEELLNECLCPH